MGTPLDRHHRAGRSPRTPKMPAKTYGAFLIKEGILANWGILAVAPSPCDRGLTAQLSECDPLTGYAADSISFDALIHDAD
jgi:hypothetical protein